VQPASAVRTKERALAKKLATKGRARARKAAARKPAAPKRSAGKTAGSKRTSTRTRKPGRLSSAATVVKGALAGAVATVTTKLPGDTDALSLLERDHREFERLLGEGENTSAAAAKTRTQLLNKLTADLSIHERIEEEILYPALKVHPESKDLALEGYQEHHVADVLVTELHALAKDDERWGAKFKVLKENLEHHIEDEEGPMFRTARAVLTRDELQRLGAEMAAMKAKAGNRGPRARS
jgi:hemerythrin HHE cation binding domain-containing protein